MYSSPEVRGPFWTPYKGAVDGVTGVISGIGKGVIGMPTVRRGSWDSLLRDHSLFHGFAAQDYWPEDMLPTMTRAAMTASATMALTGFARVFNKGRSVYER